MGNWGSEQLNSLAEVTAPWSGRVGPSSPGQSVSKSVLTLALPRPSGCGAPQPACTHRLLSEILSVLTESVASVRHPLQNVYIHIPTFTCPFYPVLHRHCLLQHWTHLLVIKFDPGINLSFFLFFVFHMLSTSTQRLLIAFPGQWHHRGNGRASGDGSVTLKS